MAEGGFKATKLGRLIQGKASKEKRILELTAVIELADKIMQAMKAPGYTEIVQPRLVNLWHQVYRAMLTEPNEQERLKLLGAVTIIDRFFRELDNDKQLGVRAAEELEKLKG